MGFSRFPTETWGIGNDAPESSEEDYTPETFSLAGDVQWRFTGAFWAGLVVDFAYRRFVERADSGLLASGLLPGAEDGRIVGAGWVVTRDTRTNSAFPRGGGLYQLRAVEYGGLVGSDFGFMRLSLDLRRYVPVFPRHVVAVQLLGVASTGSPPFDRMPALGGEQLLRGYYEGRFRDRHLVAVQAEYRLAVWWRFGLVAFGSAGQVAPRFGAFGWDRFRLAVGGGLRFRFTKDGMNLRLDVARGFTGGSGGLYLGVREVF